MSAPRDNHYTPRFYLRNFAVDPQQKRISTVGKSGPFALWKERSIESVGVERDLYADTRHGAPVCVEAVINRRIETPIVESDTWAKITSGRTQELDVSDKPALYALIRNLEARTPHYRATGKELAQLAASDDGPVAFSDDEREYLALMRSRPDVAEAIFNAKSASLRWTEEAYSLARITVFRSPIPLRSSTTPVMAVPAPPDPRLHLPLPGMVPYSLVLALNRTTIASLIFGTFEDEFLNWEIPVEVALGFNRYFVGQFAHFEHVRHLITGREDIVAEMEWAHYDLVEDCGHKIKFRRRKER